MLQIIAPDPKKHADEICDLSAKTFGQLGYFKSLKFMREGRILKSHYDWKTSRIGIMDGKIVTHWGIYDYQNRVGRAAICVAGVGLVVTHDDYQKRGLMNETARASIEAMKDAGYDVTFLTGIDNYYSRFGYVRCWPGQTYRTNDSELANIEPLKKLECCEPGSRTDLDELYNRTHADLTGTAVHPTFVHTKRPGQYKYYVWNENGRAVGYVLVDPVPDDLVLLESAGDPELILRALAGLVANRRNKRVEFTFLHSRSPLAWRLRRGNCKVEVNYKRDGHALMRMVNLRQSFEKISGVLTQRLKDSPLKSWKGTVSIEDARENVSLEIGNGHIHVKEEGSSKHSIRGGEHIIQLIFGTHPTQETIDAAKMKLSGDAALLAPILFPHEEPQLSVSDQI
jgi:predicted acetyltransferase